MQEMQLGEFLQKVFKSTEDKITPYGKGEPGADWLQEVMEKDEFNLDRILYESKNTKGWSNDWMEKLQEDMKVSKANIGIIFSRALPKNLLIKMRNFRILVIFLYVNTIIMCLKFWLRLKDGY